MASKRGTGDSETPGAATPEGLFSRWGDCRACFTGCAGTCSFYLTALLPHTPPPRVLSWSARAHLHLLCIVDEPLGFHVPPLK